MPKNQSPTLTPSLPAACYLDPNILEQEYENIWRKQWLYLMRADRLEQPGDYQVFQIAGREIFVVLDQHDLQTGYRQEGMFNAALSFSGKAVSGVGIVLGGLLLNLIAFPTQTAPAAVPADMIFRLGLVVGVLLPLLYLLPIALVSRYRITQAVHADIRAQLDARDAAGKQSLSP